MSPVGIEPTISALERPQIYASCRAVTGTGNVDKYFTKIKGLSFETSIGPVAQSVYRLVTGWTVRGSNPGGREILRTCPDRPCGPPSLLYKG